MGGNLSLGSHSTSLQVLSYYAKASEMDEKDLLKGKTAIVTGGNSGIGLELCKTLAYGGCRVIMCSRSVDNGEKVKLEEIGKHGHGGYVVEDLSLVQVLALDLNNLQSVRDFVTEFATLNIEHVDYLFLNAGIMALADLQYTQDGCFEKQIGVNHFGHAYLCKLLFQNKAFIEKPEQPLRIVTTSSIAHKFLADMSISDLHYKKRSYTKWGAYGSSKLANVMYAKSLNKRHLTGKSSAVSVRPGIIATNLWKETGAFARFISYLFEGPKSIPQGASSLLYAGLEPKYSEPAWKGSIIDNCAAAEVDATGPFVNKYSDSNCEQLWDVTMEQLEEAEKTLLKK